MDLPAHPCGVNNFSSVADIPLLPSKAQRKAGLWIISELLLNGTYVLTVM